MDQLAASALAEKVSALMFSDCLEHRASLGGRGAFERVLAKVPGVEPEEHDRSD